METNAPKAISFSYAPHDTQTRPGYSRVDLRTAMNSASRPFPSPGRLNDIALASSACGSTRTKWFAAFLAVLWASCPLLFSQAFQPRSEFGALLEPVGKTINGAGQSEDAFANYWGVMKENEKPLVYMTYVNLRGVDKHWAKQLKSDLLNYGDKFIIPQIGLSMTVNAQDHYEGDVAAGLLDADIASFLDGLEELARPAYLRIGFEFNGTAWNGYLPNPYKQAFIRVTNKLRERNLEVATVWDAITDDTTNYLDFYPGDSYVDWFGINVFAVRDLTASGTYAFLNLAASRRKPVMIGESTPQLVGVLNGQMSWNRWFVPYFNLIRSRPEIKMFCYINWDWSLYPAWPTWGDCRLEANDYVKQQFSNELDSPLYLHATTEKEFRSRLGYTDNIAPSAIATLRFTGAPFPVTLQWDAASDPSGIARYEIYRNGVLVGASVKPSFQDSEVEAGGHYQYAVKVFDRAGNGSALSNTLDGDLPNPMNKTLNGEFDEGENGWSLVLYPYTSNDEATWVVDSGSVLSGRNSAHVLITAAYGTIWQVQLQQPVKILQGKSYLVTYQARADRNVSIHMIMQQDHAPNTLILDGPVALTTSAHTFSATFVANTTDTVNLAFEMGLVPAEVWIDAVSIVETTPWGGRLINLSILTSLATAGDSFTMGYVVGGGGTNGTKPLVLRAAGPSLGALGVPGTLDDPQLELFAGATKVGENDNWGGSITTANAMSAVGAFAYTGPSSRDAAVALSVACGDNSVKVSGVGSCTGMVIAEIYDATPTASFTGATPRLVNVSVLKQLGTGFTVGFVVGGNGTKNVLVRAIGPTLGTAFGVPGEVSDPKLALYSGQSVIASNDNWGGGPSLAAAFSSVGAFALPAISLDAAIVVSLNPGNYTVQVSGVAGATGMILVEIYEVP